MYSPEEAYKQIKLNEKFPLKKLYLSIPLNFSISNELKENLQALTQAEMVFLEESKFIDSLANTLSEKDLQVDTILSISRRGEYVYQALIHSNKELNSIPHFNIKFNREDSDQIELPNIAGSQILLIDDIFGTGFTFDKIINAIGDNKEIMCLFLFGPKPLIDEFNNLYPKAKLLFAFELQEDPRMDLVNFTDLESFIDLKDRYGMESILLKRLFGSKSEDALLVIDRLKYL